MQVNIGFFWVKKKRFSGVLRNAHQLAVETSSGLLLRRLLPPSITTLTVPTL